MASRSVNEVTLLGNLTRDPELKYTPSGAPVCSFGVATNRSWTTAEGQIKEDTQYHRITAWNKLAELCSKLLSKGKKVYLTGRLVYRSFTGKDGQQKNITEIVLEDFIVLTSVKRAVDEDVKTEEPPTEDVSFESDEAGTPASPEEKTTSSSKGKEAEETINPDDIPF